MSFLETPQLLIEQTHQNAWLAAFASLLPALFLGFMFLYIFQHSSRPFPELLEEHLGSVPGRILGFIYIFVFMLTAAFSLRLFVDFIETNVLPATPISIFITVLLFAGFYALRGPFHGFARVLALFTMAGLPFIGLIFVLLFTIEIDPANLLPVGYISATAFGLGVFGASFILGKVIVLLTLGFFVDDRTKVAPAVYSALILHTLLVGMVTAATLMTFGSHLADLLTFPVFTIITMLHIGTFIQNIDIVFIGIWITGVFGALTTSWFMVLYTLQKVFRLSNYSFMVAPSSLILGVVALQLSANILHLQVLNFKIVPYIYLLFYIAIPFLLFLIILTRSIFQERSAEPQNQVSQKG